MFTWFAGLPPHLTFVGPHIYLSRAWTGPSQECREVGGTLPSQIFQFSLISGVQWECMLHCIKEYWMVFLNVVKCTDKFPSWAENDLVCILENGWSQWSCSLRHDLSMPTQTWVGASNPTQITDACLCLFCVCASSRLAMGWSPWGQDFLTFRVGPYISKFAFSHTCLCSFCQIFFVHCLVLPHWPIPSTFVVNVSFILFAYCFLALPFATAFVWFKPHSDQWNVVVL